MYSSWDNRDSKTVICVNCEKEIENPYYKNFAEIIKDDGSEC
jgi:hypothetical protein